MLIVAIMLCLCQFLGFVAFAWLLKVFLDRKQAEIERRVSSHIRYWIEAPSEDTPSPLARLWESASVVMGRVMAQSIMASLSAEASHAARAANSAADELQGRANPLLGLLSGGKRGRGAAVARLGEMLMAYMSGAPSGSNGHDSGATTSVRDRLRKEA